MARRAGLWYDHVGLGKTVSGAIAAGNATLTDANYPLTEAICCTGYQTIFVGVEIDGGAAPTATIEALFRDEEAADGQRWKRRLLGAADGVTLGAKAIETTTALASGTHFEELRVDGWNRVTFRVTAVTNSGGTTALRILVYPGRRMPL